MSEKQFACDKCMKELANRHSLCRHKKNCHVRSVRTDRDRSPIEQHRYPYQQISSHPINSHFQISDRHNQGTHKDNLLERPNLYSMIEAAGPDSTHVTNAKTSQNDDKKESGQLNESSSVENNDDKESFDILWVKIFQT